MEMFDAGNKFVIGTTGGTEIFKLAEELAGFIDRQDRDGFEIGDYEVKDKS